MVIQMQSGDYNQYFELQKVTIEINKKGDQVRKYETVYKGYAKVTNLSGKEYWDAYSVLSENVLKFYCRWSPIFNQVNTTKYCISWHGKILDILALDNVAYKNSQCVIKCKEDSYASNKV